jgi:hypothetical protein
MTNSDKSSAMRERLVKQYGPMLGGTELRSILGYRAASTFNRAKRLNLIGVHIFQLPNRRGSFALTTDVADWLIRVSKE